MEILWSEKQTEDLMAIQKEYNLPQGVVDSIKKVLNILDTHYGADRNVYSDDGGYVALILEDDGIKVNDEYFFIIDKYNLYDDEPETESKICEHWCSDLYIVSNDYGITIVYQEEKG